jgi:hypothetical protein
MTLMDTVNIPILAVNNYVWDQFRVMDPALVNSYGKTVPFYPLGSSAARSKDSNLAQTVIYYDRIFRFRPQPFYQIKKEQFSYKINGVDTDYLAWGSALQLLLDREDDSAKDINSWIGKSGNYDKYPVFFHSMRVFIPAYAEYREVSANDPTWIGNFIIDVQYHMTSEPYDQEWSYSN